MLRSSDIHHFRLRDAPAHVPLHRVRQRDSQISSQSNVLRYSTPYAASVNDMREQGESVQNFISRDLDRNISSSSIIGNRRSLRVILCKAWNG